jgi:glyoxylase-like metal-dependent hydrolase (beta-lactamase superfamily II)
MTAMNEVFAIRYSERAATRGSHFLGPIDRAADSMPMSYFIWVVRGEWGAIVVDTGFSAETARMHGRNYLASPGELVAELGIKPSDLKSIVLTHLHYDHAGCTSDFPGVKLVVQVAELRQWCGPRARPSIVGSGLAHLVLPADVASVCRANLAGGVTWVDGDAVIAPGVSVHRLGGHTEGIQVVRVSTTEGEVVLASDASHFYENLTLRRPYPVVDDVAAATTAFERLTELASMDELIVPGHDPAVLERFPPVQRPTLAEHGVVIGEHVT